MFVKRQFVEGQVDHLKILNGPEIGQRQNFSPRLIERGAAEGWLSIGGGFITITTTPGEPDMVFRIVRTPGRYCCFDDSKLEGSEREAREHVLDNHASSGKSGFELQIMDGEGNVVRSGFVKSPDPANPAGYRQDNFYATERVS